RRGVACCHRLCVELRVRARNGAGRGRGSPPARGVRADLPAQASSRARSGEPIERCDEHRREQGLGEEEATAMGLAKMQVVAPEEAPENAETRPEELRLLEAMLFASAAPLDEKELSARLPQ